MAPSKKKIVQYIKDREARMSTVKSQWDSMFDIVGRYVNLKHEEQAGTDSKAAFVTDQVWDTTAVIAAKLMASAILNDTYPSATKSFVIRPTYWLTDNEANKKFFRWFNQRISGYLDKPETNAYLALSEGILTKIMYGTVGIMPIVEDNINLFTELPLVFKSMPLKDTRIDEGKKGKVDTAYFITVYTIRQLVNEYGFDNVSEASQKRYKARNSDKDDTKIKVVQAIEPSRNIYTGKHFMLDKDYASIHVEYDTDHILKEAGFKRMPVIISRFEKRTTEVWGRCPSIDGFPDILLANTMAESVALAVEKELDPALAIPDNGFVGNDFDTSAGSLVTYSMYAGITGNPIFPVSPPANVQIGAQFLAENKTSIERHYYLDWLYDMGAKRERSAKEVGIKHDLRGRALNPIHSREETESIIPLVKYTIGVFLDNGLLGVKADSEEFNRLTVEMGLPENIVPIIPDEVATLVEHDIPFYEIEFISPAARARNQEELRGMLSFADVMLTLSQFYEAASDSFDVDNYIHRIAKLSGLDVELLNSMDVIKDIRAQRAEQQAQQQQLEAQLIQADVGNKNADANSKNAAIIKQINA